MAKLKRWGPRARSADLPVGPTAPIFFWQAILGLLVWSTLGLACLDFIWIGSWATFGPFEPESSL